MIRPIDIEYAFDQTFIAHPESKQYFSGIVLDMIRDGINEKAFTKNNNARYLIKGITNDDLLRYILNEAIKIYNAASYYYYYSEPINSLPNDQQKINYLLQVFPSFSNIQRLIPIIANKEINVSVYFKANSNDLLCLINAVYEMRHARDSQTRTYIDMYGNVESVTPNSEIVNLFSKVEEDIKRVSTAKNIQVNYRTINKCMSDLMAGVQLKNNRNEYALEGTLFATQDVGKKRNNQEDAVTILTHPNNPEFKFLAVSDGMGGVELGDKASLYTAQKITEWFNSLPPEAYYYPEDLQTSFNNRLIEISNDIYRQYNTDYNRIMSGATFVGAIVTNDRTIISSVGDSRAYTTDGYNLNLITRDESNVWPPTIPAQAATKETLDELRFRKGNNAITRCIGQPLSNIQSTIIRNEDYIRLLLFSDGVTDLLSTDKIKLLALNTRPEDLTRTLVEEAITYDAIRFKGESADYKGVIAAGKDNATSAAFVRR